MFPHFCFAVATLLLLPLARLAADSPITMGKPVWQASAPSAIQIDRKGIAQIVNHHYLVRSPHRCFPNRQDNIVVSQKITWRIAPVEGNDPSLEATAYHVAADGKPTRLWALREPSDEGRLHCDYYETIWYGCCSAMPNHRLFNPATGRLLMEHSGRLITVEVPNSPLKRFIGYKPAESQETNAWEKHKRHIGTLTYASPDGILHRIALREIDDTGAKYEGGIAKIQIKRGHPKQEMNGDTLRLWNADGSKDARSLGQFSVVLTFSGATIEIPLRADDFATPAFKSVDCEIVRLGK